MSVFDLVFVLCAVIFHILIIGIYITSRYDRVKLRTTFGKITIGLGIPLLAVLASYALEGRPLRVLIYLAVILLYLIVELLLDFILKIEFREKPILHIPYIVLFYFACFSFIAISFTISNGWGYAVSVSFWGVLISLIFLLRGRKKSADAH